MCWNEGETPMVDTGFKADVPKAPISRRSQ